MNMSRKACVFIVDSHPQSVGLRRETSYQLGEFDLDCQPFATELPPLTFLTALLASGIAQSCGSCSWARRNLQFRR